MNSQLRPAGKISFDNTGRVVLVTGGAQGIGAAICELFAQSGATVFCADIRPPMDELARMGVGYRETDVASEESCQATVEWVGKQCGGLDVLVNDAAIQPANSYVPVHELPADLWQKMLAVNISGYTYMAKHALRIMLQQQSGVIVNLASAHAYRSSRVVPGYGPTKAANLIQAKQWALDYARFGIRCVSVSPGAIDTPLVRASLDKQGGAAELENRHPLGRMGRPAEIAHAVVWLASEGASFVTGTDLEVDGGLGAFGAFADPYPMPKPKTP
jgi:NAD(P)-dependent dehydrogenase (short-subunit alcohol dehydrogenase family)